MSTEAQKRANRAYRERHKPIQLSVQYKTDKIEGERIKQFLEQNGLTANAYIKSLIKKDLDEKNFYIDEDLKSDSNWLTGWAVTMEWWNNIIVKFVQLIECDVIMYNLYRS